jgi:leucyl aminopeptidase
MAVCRPMGPRHAGFPYMKGGRVIQFSIIPKKARLDRTKTWALFAYEKEEGFLNAPGREGVKIRESIQKEGFTGQEAQTAMAYSPDGLLASKAIALGLGSKVEMTAESLRRAGGRLARKAREIHLEEALVEWPRTLKADHVKAFTEGIILGSYQYNRYKTQLKEIPKSISRFTFHVPADIVNEVRKAVDISRHYCDGVLLARDLVNGAPSDITPKLLAKTARKIAKGPIRMKLYNRAQLKRMGAGGILGVNAGSAQEPCLIHLHYKTTEKPRKSVALVGKGITFDSGGLSLKPAGSMETMKMDMSGAAAVLGVFSQLSALKPSVEVHGIIPATENMPGGNALKPGDVLKALNGKTMEILNTDAEGRVILSDALSFAVRQKPDAIIDLATLTGACIIALGALITGALSNDQKLLESVKQATEAEGERIWELPLVKEYREDIKSKVADMKNIGGNREAGTIIGGLFLQEFVGETPWVHLDIAGPAFMEKENPALPYLPFGGTGLMVRSLLTFLRET